MWRYIPCGNFGVFRRGSTARSRRPVAHPFSSRPIRLVRLSGRHEVREIVFAFAAVAIVNTHVCPSPVVSAAPLIPFFTFYFLPPLFPAPRISTLSINPVVFLRYVTYNIFPRTPPISFPAVLCFFVRFFTIVPPPPPIHR